MESLYQNFVVVLTLQCSSFNQIKIGPYDYEGLVKSFIRQDRHSASTARRRLSYTRVLLKSYNTVIARIDKPNNVLYITKERYSNTTSRQTRILLAFAEDLHIFNSTGFNLGETYTNTEVADYWEKTRVLISKYIRARSNKDRIKQQIRQHHNMIKSYCTIHDELYKVPEDILRLMFVNQLIY